ncbi:MAG: hypothetical protein WCI46_09070 [Verrucomicrobiota bacterium]
MAARFSQGDQRWDDGGLGPVHPHAGSGRLVRRGIVVVADVEAFHAGFLEVK